MDPVVVVGGGVAGLACAREVAAAGLPVRVLDRGRGVGGRLGLRERDGRPVDLGAPAFDATDPAFLDAVRDWHGRGLVRPWRLHRGWKDPASPGLGHRDDLQWTATGGLRTLAEDLATGLHVESGRIVEAVGPGPTVDGDAAAAVVLAMPDPQAARLLEETVEPEEQEEWYPTLVLAAGWPDDVRPQRDAFGLALDDDPVLTVIADMGRRHDGDRRVLIAHSTAAFAAQHLDDPPAAEDELLEALLGFTGAPDPAWTHVHRWTFAGPHRPQAEAFGLGPDGIHRCGDGWHAAGASGVERAVLSGRALGRALAARHAA